MVDRYVSRKNGQERIPLIHPIADEILAPTYGVPIYQETVMVLAHKLAGIPLSDAYSLIKAISKKIRHKVEEYRERFLSGCLQSGVQSDQAQELWSVIDASARYLFNASHAMAYAHIAYQTAWVKAYYPLEFMIAILDCDIDQRAYTGRDPLLEHLEDCTRQGISILPPHVNHSGLRHRVVNGSIAWSLASVKGVPESAAIAIEREASISPFTDLFDFARRVPKSLCPRAAIRNLIAIGAMPGEQSRAVQDATIDRAMKLAAGEYKRPEKQRGVWGIGIQSWTRAEELEHERLLTGMFLTGHPIDEYPRLEKLGPLSPRVDGMFVMQVGVVTAIETRHTVAKGKEFTTFVLLCKNHSTECVIWDLKPEVAKYLVDGKLIVARGRASAKGGKVGMTVNEINSPGEYLGHVMRFKTAVIAATEAEAAMADFALNSITDKEGVQAFVLTPEHEYRFHKTVVPGVETDDLPMAVLEERKERKK